MASIASSLADKVIITSDNPRDELPEEIIAEIEKGVPASKTNRVVKNTDRSEAIKMACLMAGPGDIILVAGKGHETYQEIKGKRYPFDDREELRKNFNLSQTEN